VCTKYEDRAESPATLVYGRTEIEKRKKNERKFMKKPVDEIVKLKGVKISATHHSHLLSTRTKILGGKG